MIMENINFKGKNYSTLRELADHLDVESEILRHRIASEWPEEAWGRPILAGISPNNPGIEFEGKWYPSIKQLSESIGIKYDTLHKRIKAGWDISRWAEKPGATKPSGPARKINYKGTEFESVTALAIHLDVGNSTLNRRINDGLPEEEWGIQRGTGRPGTPTEVNGKKYRSHAEIAREVGISNAQMSKRIERKQDLHAESKYRGKVVFESKEYQSVHLLATELATNNSQTPRVIARKIGKNLDEGDSLEDAIEDALIDPRQFEIKYDDIIYESIKDLSRELKIPYPTLVSRIKKGWSEEFWAAEKLPTASPDFYYCIENPAGLSRTCSLYIVELRRFSGYQKIGIAASPIHRYDREYGSEQYVQEFKNRLEALIFEATLLNLTDKYANCPEELSKTVNGKRWHGITEVRHVNWEVLELTVDHLRREIDETGMEDFAIKYIPMSENQRNLLSNAIEYLAKAS